MEIQLANQTEISQLLNDKGIKPSHQRIKIYEYLMKNKKHPTVDMIYQELLPEMPTLSRTTVYNTVKSFSEHGLVQTLTIEENENRYEIDLHEHGHFKCESCDKVFDFPIKNGQSENGMLEGFEIKQKHIYYKGTCKMCQDKN